LDRRAMMQRQKSVPAVSAASTTKVDRRAMMLQQKSMRSMVQQASHRNLFLAEYERQFSTVQQVRTMEMKIQQVQQQSKAEIEALRSDMEERKRAMEEELRQELSLNKSNSNGGDDVEGLPETEVAELMIEDLKEEQQELITELSKLQKDDIPAVERDIAGLIDANANIENMTNSLNAFVKKKTEQNRKLEASYAQMEEIYNGLVALEYEEPMKQIFRHGIYRIAKRVSEGDDPSVLRLVMGTIEECEGELGVTPMDISTFNAGDTKARSDALQNVKQTLISSPEDDDINATNDGDVDPTKSNDVDDKNIEDLNLNVEEYAMALEQVSSKLDKKQFSMLLAIFKLLDKDKNGSIDPEEFRTGIKMLNRRLPATSQIDDPDKLFRILDADGNGTIDIDEFQQLHISL